MSKMINLTSDRAIRICNKLKREEVIQWMDDNTPYWAWIHSGGFDSYGTDAVAILFNTDQDAVAFKLKFGI